MRYQKWIKCEICWLNFQRAVNCLKFLLLPKRTMEIFRLLTNLKPLGKYLKVVTNENQQCAWLNFAQLALSKEKGLDNYMMVSFAVCYIKNHKGESLISVQKSLNSKLIYPTHIIQFNHHTVFLQWYLFQQYWVHMYLRSKIFLKH